MNNKLINDNKKNIVMSIMSFTENSKKKMLLDPDPLFPEVDPRIRIHVKMKRKRKTEFHNLYFNLLLSEFYI